MMLFNDKLYKPLSLALAEHGFTAPTPLQEQCLSKINAGQDVIGIGPERAGKSTLIAISTIQKLKEAFEDAPRAFILAANAEKVLTLKTQFELLSPQTNLRVRCAYDGGKITPQGEDIYMGADVVIGTPKQSFELYLKQYLNLNQLKLFVIDDAELMIKYAYQSQIDRLIMSLPKCQHLVFTTDYTPKIERLVEKCMVAPLLMEVQH